MITIETITQRIEREESLKGWLKTKSTEEFRHFMASAWVASLFSTETIEELYQELQQQEATSSAETEEYYEEEYVTEVGMD
jgi:hypothetical protein